MKAALINIGLLASPKGSKALGGLGQSSVTSIKNASVLMEDGVITQVKQGELTAQELAGCEVIDAQGRLVTPGLVDAHTHLVFGGWRAHELEQKLKGVPYLDILKAGGGILSTVKETRESSQEDLVKKAQLALAEMLSLGTTTCEAKSGYGLNLADEIKQLRAARELNAIQPVEVVSTLMAAHALPPEYQQDRRGFLDLIKQEILPKVTEENLAEFCDVFCEEGVFTVEESKELLLFAQQMGLKSKIHADEIMPIGGSELAGELQAVSAEHLIAIRESGIKALRQGGTIACLLPATSFYLDKPFAPARQMINEGVPVAVATDFNPGSCPSLNLQLCMNLACYKYKMQPEEVLCAVTLNAAAAINRADRIGTVEQGKQADLVIWDAPDLAQLCYRFGSNLVATVIKKGQVVVNR